MPKPNTKTPITKSEALPALPPRRTRRRSVRPSHSWCFRKPPSRKRVAVAAARFQPAPVIPVPDICPITDLTQ
ncbi:MAG TPA: hypothetical protein VMW18_09295 [Candidatus Binatia bacterium]|nr:hypothetical protein [Candidatus Binatia bacterium]